MIAAAEVSVDSPASPQLAAELWISLVSLLSSHVAMHSIARPESKLRVHSSSSTRLDVLGPIGKLTILAPDACGTGVTEFRPEAGELGDEYDTFFFTEEGLLQFAALDGALDMEASVDNLLRKVQA
jgi:hypothetical protein